MNVEPVEQAIFFKRFKGAFPAQRRGCGRLFQSGNAYCIGFFGSRPYALLGCLLPLAQNTRFLFLKALTRTTANTDNYHFSNHGKSNGTNNSTSSGAATLPAGTSKRATQPDANATSWHLRLCIQYPLQTDTRNVQRSPRARVR